eukprot:scaffold2062_cov333-Pavlova_lutheri.AAC.4
MGDLRLGKVLNFPEPHGFIKLILTWKDEPPPKRLHVQGNFLRVGGAQERRIALLTVERTSKHGENTYACVGNLTNSSVVVVRGGLASRVS